MRTSMLAIGVIALLGCTTEPNRTETIGGQEYIVSKQRLLGVIPVGETKTKPKKPMTKAEQTRLELRAPAKWLLWISGPTTLIAFALTLCCRSIPIQKLSGTIAACGAVVTGGTAAWLLATMYLIVFAVLIAGIMVYMMFVLKDRGIFGTPTTQQGPME